MTVTINLSGHGQFAGVVETLPDGFSYTSSTLSANQASELSGQRVRFTLFGESVFSYTVTASDMAGPYTFSGELTTDPMEPAITVGGATSVTVAPQASASRTLSPAPVEAGGEVTVTISATNYGASGAVIETLPTGFTYQSSNLPGSEVNASGQNVEFTLSGEPSFTYTVTASATPGTYDFSGMLTDSEQNDHTVGGTSSITVEAAQATTPMLQASASRMFAPATVEAGAEVTVTITATDYGEAGGLTETLPAGFTYESSSLMDYEVQASGQEVRFTLQGVDSFTYTVTASSAPGTHTFSGMLRDVDRNDHIVGGDSVVTVMAVPGGPRATRSFNPTTVAAGGEVTVTITATGYGEAGGLTETLPAGFTYESSSLMDFEVQVTGQEVRFTLQGVDSFTYTVTGSSTPGNHTFSGMLRGRR